MTYPFANLPGNLAAFCALLRRDYGFRTGPRELQDAARALEIVELADERAVRNTLRPVLAGRFEDARAFDAAFDRFFGGGREGPPPRDLPAHAASGRPSTSRDVRATFRNDSSSVTGEDGLTGAPVVEAVSVEGVALDARGSDARATRLRASASLLHGEGAVPMLDPSNRAWREAAARFVSHLRAGLSRRWRPARQGQRFDLRRTLRTSLHTGGDVVMPRWRARPRRRPQILMFVDGSRSMEAYVCAALQMAVALAAVTLDVEAFTFSTALRRVTRDVRRAAAGERRSLHLEHAWGGGTTIGACLREFLRRYGERVLGRETVVVIASDGLEVGDPGVLRDAMAQLARRSAGIVWLNPLLETPGYEPTALGMRVARPYITVLASVNDVASLARLARVIRLR